MRWVVKMGFEGGDGGEEGRWGAVEGDSRT